jgi:hypothetical protein
MKIRPAREETKPNRLSRANTKPAIGRPKPITATPAPTRPAKSSTEPTCTSRDDLSQTKVAPEPIIGTSANLEAIRVLGSLLDDLERVKIANGNRIGALERQHGEAPLHLYAIQKQVEALEHQAELELIREWRKNPLAPWSKQQRGVGEKSIARLIAIIGDPAERPNVAKLWAYCGHGDPLRSQKRKGMTQDELFAQGNPSAKKRVWLIATAQIKAGVRSDKDDDDNVISRYALSPAGQNYLDRRAMYETRTHQTPCARCGPAGHPAAVGSPWSPAHQHAAAIRYLGKEFLKELWIASRATYQSRHETH